MAYEAEKAFDWRRKRDFDKALQSLGLKNRDNKVLVGRLVLCSSGKSFKLYVLSEFVGFVAVSGLKRVLEGERRSVSVYFFKK